MNVNSSRRNTIFDLADDYERDARVCLQSPGGNRESRANRAGGVLGDAPGVFHGTAGDSEVEKVAPVSRRGKLFDETRRDRRDESRPKRARARGRTLLSARRTPFDPPLDLVERRDRENRERAENIPPR